MSSPSYSLFAMGNPLLDIQVRNGEALLEKYTLKSNDAILASESHAPIYEEITSKHDVTYVAGGAGQNSARAAAYVLPPNSVVYTGAVGSDDLAGQLRAANEREGVDSKYYVVNGEKTGACAVVLTNHDRSLVTTLRAAEKFDKAHLSSPTIAPLIDNAKYIYVGGFFLTHGIESALLVAKKASLAGKVFVTNLSAPFIPQFFKEQLDSLLPYCDIVIGNESEAESYATAQGLPETKNLAAIAKYIAASPKANPSRPRTVVITHGNQPTIVVSAENLENVKVFPIQPLSDSQIVDTNGAGDMFAGGFVGALILGKSTDEAVEVGHKLGAMCVGQIGSQLKWPKENVL
ncbi:Ribokinase-like protein [Hysterangium stoloniferum]|nr:Ribokinase-like protein [Hysterangium stoloniferum]